jgi:hypothetical protein
MIAVLSTPESMSAEQYDRLVEQVDEARASPAPGHRLHVCFGHGDHLMLFDVWDSVEELQAFAATIAPILANQQIVTAPPQPLEVHRLVDDSDSGLRTTITELRQRAFFIRPVEKPRKTILSIEATPHGAKERDTGMAASQR